MEFLKKHYEKILLSVVLLGLMGATLWLPTAIKDAEADSQMGASAPARTKGLPPLDLSAERQAMQSVTNLHPVVLSGPHNLFNPVTWKKMPDGTLRKILVEGPDALSIVDIKPLFMTINYDRAAGPGFYLSVKFESGKRIPSEYAKINEKTKAGIFTIKEAKGPAEDPSELVLELANHEMVSIVKGKPYKQVESYTADLKYEPEAKTFTRLRVDEPLTISEESYKVVAITSNEVRVVSNSTGKQTTILWNGTPTP